MSHSSYNSIDSLRLCIQEIKKYYKEKNESIPKEINFYGTIKLHGTNAGIGFNNEKGLWCQSRSNIITSHNDNADFAKFVETNKDYFLDLFKLIKKSYSIDTDSNSIIIFGEWCGYRIQNKVAICNMERFFAIFDIKIVNNIKKEDNYYQNSKFPEIKSDYDRRVFNIHEFKTYNIKLNLSDLESVQQTLIKYIEDIESQCPFAEQFDKKGPGEGIVFVNYISPSKRFIFKVKGSEHKASREKNKVEVRTELFSSYDNFISRVVTENRFVQALDYIYKFNPSLETYNRKPIDSDIKYIVEWIINDVYKEEKDIVDANNFDEKKINKLVSKKVYSMFSNFIKN
jgi:hypothetical protein